MKKIIALLSLFIMNLGLSACSIFSDSDHDPYKGKSEQSIYSTAETQLGKHNYTHAVKAYEALDSYYPFGSHSEQAQLDIIYAYYKDNDPVSALAASSRYIHLYPESPRVSYAYYMKAVTQFSQDRTFAQRYFPVDLSGRDLTHARAAYANFAQVIRLFPHSPYAVDAKQRMVYLRNLFAAHELDVANFYYTRKDYIASANRANEIIQHYQGTPSVQKALIMMVNSYDKLGLPNQANTTDEILRLNYPNSTLVKKLDKERRKAGYVA